MPHIFDHFIKDALDNPPFYTTAEVTDVNAEKMYISIVYTDKNGQSQAKNLDVKSSTELSKFRLGDTLDIQICDGIYPAFFYAKSG